ncbi:MAG: hypothetical protein ACYS26_15960 [Planctomycetota bacterium]|jgi:hypothetical protein
MLNSPLRELSVGEVLDQSFTLLRRNLVPVMVLGAVAFLPAALVGLFIPAIGSFVSLIGLPFLVAGCIWVADKGIRGGEVHTGGALRAGFSGGLKLALLWPLWSFARSALMVIFIVPGALFVGAFFSWKQVLLIEENWGMLGRSAKLSGGSLGRIIWVIFIAWLISSLPQAGLTIGQIAAAGDRDPFESMGSFNALDFAVLMGTLVLTTFTQAYFNNAVTLLYYDRRVRVDALDVETSADQFDAALAADPGAGDAQSGAEPVA